MRSHLPPDVDSYLNDFVDRIGAILGDRLIGLYLHGSAVQSDFQPGRSDIDVLGLVSGKLNDPDREHLTDSLSHKSLPVPARGLEFLLCTAESARNPVFAFPYEYALSTGVEWGTVWEPSGCTSDTLVHALVCQQSGRALFGPPSEQTFGPISRDLLQKALIAELEWHIRELPKQTDHLLPANAILNAARSVYASQTGHIISKSEGARLWLKDHPSDQLVLGALSFRRGEGLLAPKTSEITKFIKRAIASVERVGV
ncbi:MAG: aminoglycoside adenylyltransferase domain-containing protein [Pseudomonadota bacterium]